MSIVNVNSKKDLKKDLRLIKYTYTDKIRFAGLGP